MRTGSLSFRTSDASGQPEPVGYKQGSDSWTLVSLHLITYIILNPQMTQFFPAYLLKRQQASRKPGWESHDPVYRWEDAAIPASTVGDFRQAIFINGRNEELVTKRILL